MKGEQGNEQGCRGDREERRREGREETPVLLSCINKIIYNFPVERV